MLYVYPFVPTTFVSLLSVSQLETVGQGEVAGIFLFIVSYG